MCIYTHIIAIRVCYLSLFPVMPLAVSAGWGEGSGSRRRYDRSPEQSVRLAPASRKLCLGELGRFLERAALRAFQGFRALWAFQVSEEGGGGDATSDSHSQFLLSSHRLVHLLLHTSGPAFTKKRQLPISRSSRKASVSTKLSPAVQRTSRGWVSGFHPLRISCPGAGPKSWKFLVVKISRILTRRGPFRSPEELATADQHDDEEAEP